MSYNYALMLAYKHCCASNKREKRFFLSGLSFELEMSKTDVLKWICNNLTEIITYPSVKNGAIKRVLSRSHLLKYPKLTGNNRGAKLIRSKT